MSGRVVGDVCDYSRAKGCDRNVLFALAEAAHRDGVSWLPIDAPRNKPEECITHAAKCSRRQAIRSIQSLVELGELEVRKARRGRARINVYRVVVGQTLLNDVDYTRLPFALDRPFGLGANLAPSHEDDQVPNRAATECQIEPGLGAKSDRDRVPNATALRAREKNTFGVQPSSEPSPKPSEEPSAAGPRTKAQVQGDEQIEPAAAAEAARGERLVAEIESLPGFDEQSWRALSQVTGQLADDDVEEALEKLRRRKGVANPIGLLTVLLRVRLEQRRREEAQLVDAELERRKKRGRAEKLAELLDYHAIRSLPAEERLAFLEAELEAAARAGELVPAKEREQLRAIAKDDRRESPRAGLERWIREEAPGLEHEQVRQEIDAFCDEQGLDHIERGALQELAEEARGEVGAADEEAAA